ncbi:uncharacterized protein LOC117299198 [Asterias rubens]|uniref:uncharacterized protein LOC117299198 n=1 Tax=Asterias rubens TaxID=7604 RepID=UPI001455AC72|nr:uncharacterized protein LOC117299198 [Asterias rubens]
MAAIKEKRRPSPKDRLLTQKVIVDEFIHCREKPSRFVFRSIANTIIAMSPLSFENDCGTGSEGFARSLETTYYNHHTIRQAMAEKRKHRDLNSTADKVPRKNQVKDSYGCSQWQPVEFPEGENQDSLEEKRKWLDLKFQKRDRDTSKVNDYMECTYFSQRCDINKQPAALEVVKQKWLFLFEPRYLFDHFKSLIGHQTNTVFMNNLASKGDSIMRFMTETKKVSEKWQQLLRAAEEHSPAQRVSQRQCATICILPGYFQEKEELFLQEVKVL